MDQRLRIFDNLIIGSTYYHCRSPAEDLIMNVDVRWGLTRVVPTGGKR
jgi:hypothetical protein